MDGQKTNGMAIAALVLGIVGIIIFPIIGAILAIIFGILAMKQIAKSQEKGKGMAITGIIMGIAGIIIFTALIFIGALAYFGVLSPAKMLPDKCTISGGFSCTDFQVTQQNVMIEIQNNLGTDAENVMIRLTDPEGKCSGEKLIGSMQNGETTSIDFPCTFASGRFRGAIAVTYQRAGQTIQHTATGDITAEREIVAVDTIYQV